MVCIGDSFRGKEWETTDAVVENNIFINYSNKPCCVEQYSNINAGKRNVVKKLKYSNNKYLLDSYVDKSLINK